MTRLLRLLCLGLGMALGAAPAIAQQQFDSGGAARVSVYPNPGATPIPVSGSFSATLSGFTPNSTGAANLSANGATPVSVALPTGTVVDVTNTGANDANVTLSVGSGTAASTDFTIKAGAAVGLTVGSNTFLNAVTTTGATVLNIKGGTGLVTGYGGGSSGGTSSNASVGTTGATAPGSATLIGTVDGSGNLQAAVMPDAGNGTTGATTTQRVTLASDSTGQVKLASGANVVGAVTQSGTWTVQAGNTAGCPSTAPISQATSTDIHTMSTKGYICSIVLVISDAESIALIEGTGTVCASGTAVLIGSATVANGMPVSANGGFSAVSATPWLQMVNSADHLCLLQSGSGRLAGVITYSDH